MIMSKEEAIRILKETSVTAATVPGTHEWQDALQMAIVALTEEEGCMLGDERIPLTMSFNSLTDSIRAEGTQIKSIIVMEECSELIKAVSKILRCKDAELPVELKNDLTEEMADVYICLSLLTLIYDISWSELQDWIWYKIERQEARDRQNEQDS